MAHAGRRRSQAGTAIANSAAHWTGYGSDSSTGSDSGAGSGSNCSSSDSSTGSGSGPRDPAAVHDPRQHKAGEAGHGRGTHRRRDPVEVSTLLISNINDNAGGK
jgi:hypothetical protein